MNNADAAELRSILNEEIGKLEAHIISLIVKIDEITGYDRDQDLKIRNDLFSSKSTISQVANHLKNKNFITHSMYHNLGQMISITSSDIIHQVENLVFLLEPNEKIIQSTTFITRNMSKSSFVINTVIQSIMSTMSDKIVEGEKESSENQRLRDLIPPEAPAPVRVRILDGRLVLINEKNFNGSISPDSIENIIKGLANILRRSLDLLGLEHNLDRRFISACIPLCQHLETPLSQLSIEALGLNWQIVSLILEKFREEVPEIVLIQLDQVMKSTNVILSQYEEWRAFLAAEAVIGLSDEEKHTIVESAEAMLSEFDNYAESIDEKIGQRFKEMVTPSLQGVINADTISVPLIGSMTNLFAQMSYITISEPAWIVRNAEKFPFLLIKAQTMAF